MVKYICNAFSLNMLSSLTTTIVVKELSLHQAKLLADGVPSAVGHADTAMVFENTLGLPVPMQRVNVVVNVGEEILVGQYSGPRLPEGATELPEGAQIKWCLVTIG